MASPSESQEPETATLGLAQVIQAITSDLFEAQENAAQRPFGLFLREIEVELAFTVEQAKGGGGISLTVLGVGGSYQNNKGLRAETVHRIQLKLGPKESSDETSTVTVTGQHLDFSKTPLPSDVQVGLVASTPTNTSGAGLQG